MPRRDRWDIWTILEEWYTIDVSDECILCSRRFWWEEQIIWKLPEWVFFCLECSKKSEDNNVYEFPEEWVTIPYTKWQQFVLKIKE